MPRYTELSTDRSRHRASLSCSPCDDVRPTFFNWFGFEASSFPSSSHVHI